MFISLGFHVQICIENASIRVALEAFFYIPSIIARKITTTLRYQSNEIYRDI